MNKFKRLQLLGTTIIFLPAGIFGGAYLLYKTDTNKTEIVEVSVVTEIKPKTDTVFVVKKEVPRAQESVVKKPIVITNPQVLITPKVEEVKVEQNDSIVVKSNVGIDTTDQV
jgi:hypothetical protein